MNYDYVRPKGERLKTFGGTASGYESLKTMFTKINNIINSGSIGINMDGTTNKKLEPIDVMDIVNIIGENVVVGGVRRTSEVVLFDVNDNDILHAKDDLYELSVVDEKNIWTKNEAIAHRTMSNNSMFYKSKPSRAQLHNHLMSMKNSGEPGFLNEFAANLRNENFKGANPCMEALLDNKQLCNLTTVNVMGFVENGKLNWADLIEAQCLSVRAAIRMTMLDLELHEWNKKQKSDRIVGCSLTGWQDMVNATNMSINGQKRLLGDLKAHAYYEADLYSENLKIKRPNLITTMKPEGSLSQLAGVSSGIHYSHAPYFKRRVRINANDPLLTVCKKLEYEIETENGHPQTKIVTFYCKAPEGRTKYYVSAIEQLENYLMFMEYYVDHNCSITIHVRPNEWREVEEWLWNHWDEVVAVTFLALDGGFYDQMPYETIEEGTYLRNTLFMKPFDASLISKYENEKHTIEVGDEECENGACPIR
jgi:ribonucleoside-diphosphate reductase alpha chain/ribonucleoside-triphosphate reductase